MVERIARISFGIHGDSGAVIPGRNPLAQVTERETTHAVAGVAGAMDTGVGRLSTAAPAIQAGATSIVVEVSSMAAR